ncbi:MAG: hypothetical protein GY864_09385 [Desulfobacterales bacterium]|nr:hypothetical protein [Desulfobacterales bacterium]
MTIITSILSILKHNVFYIGYTIPPLFVIIIPLVILSLQINNRCGYEPLSPGNEFIITAWLSENSFKEDKADTLERARCKTTAGIALLTSPLRIPEEGTVQWRAQVRDNTDPGRESVRIEIGQGLTSNKDVAVIARSGQLSPDVIKGSSWDILIHNAEGFLSSTSPFKRISISYERAEYPFLWWQMDALVLYFLLTLVFALIFKPIIKVNI